MTSQIDYILLKELENNSRSDDLLHVQILREGNNTSDHFPVIADLYTTLKIYPKCQKSNVLSTIKWEKVEDTKGVIRIRISKKNRQDNGQKKKYKRTNNDQQNIHIKLKIE